LLLAEEQVRLAPLYDIASALPYGTHERGLRFAMKIGGDYRVFPERSRWPAAARDLGLESEVLVARVRELAAVAPDAFRDAAKSAEVDALERELPGRLVDLVADRVTRCMRVVGAARHG
jgi:serine/threonine-protein kinase HipA